MDISTEETMPRVVVVTGGGTGIGRADAQRFAAEGAQVHIIGRREEPLARVVKEHPDLAIHPRVADLTDTADVLRLGELFADRPVDVLVNNAGGIVRDVEPGLAGKFEDFRRTVELNLLTTMNLTEVLWPKLRRPGGRVVGISSIAGQRGGGDAYGAAKAGLAGWAFDLAKVGGKDGITVNIVSPGYVQDTEFFNETGRSKRHDTLVAETLLGRAGTPADIAGIVNFLASDDASWITGQVIGVNGGALLGR
jgi:3-oxoacyl-[acyl-carrier protein] reductase